jgi:hypothetical protein
VGWPPPPPLPKLNVFQEVFYLKYTLYTQSLRLKQYF